MRSTQVDTLESPLHKMDMVTLVLSPRPSHISVWYFQSSSCVHLKLKAYSKVNMRTLNKTHLVVKNFKIHIKNITYRGSKSMKHRFKLRWIQYGSSKSCLWQYVWLYHNFICVILHMDIRYPKNTTMFRLAKLYVKLDALLLFS